MTAEKREQELGDREQEEDGTNQGQAGKEWREDGAAQSAGVDQAGEWSSYSYEKTQALEQEAAAGNEVEVHFAPLNAYEHGSRRGKSAHSERPPVYEAYSDNLASGAVQEGNTAAQQSTGQNAVQGAAPYFPEQNPKRVSVWIALLLSFVMLCIGAVIMSQLIRFFNPIMETEQFQYLSESYSLILDEYLEEPAKEDLLNGAIEGMVYALDDPYSEYMVEESGDEYMASYEDSFVGIGVVVQNLDGKFTVQSVNADSPAEHAGIQAGDAILAVNGTEITTQMDLVSVAEMIRGPVDTEVSLTLLRDGETFTLTATRQEMPVYTVSSAMKGEIGYLKIDHFADATAVEVDEALQALRAAQMQGLVIDMRDNPGGLLNVVVEVAGEFVPQGEIIVTLQGKEGRKPYNYISAQEEPWGEIPIAILVNGNTASAAEVLTAALMEHNGAEVIGETTYGKGVAQTFRQLPDLSVIKLTNAQWLTPKGNTIHEVGIEPTIPVEPVQVDYVGGWGEPWQLGDYGLQVEDIQHQLLELGYAEPAGMFYGAYDEATSALVRAFQTAEGLEATGQVNDTTAMRIYDRMQELYGDETLDVALKTLQNKS